MENEERTINLMKYYKNSSNVVQHFEDIISNCKKDGSKFVDSEFYPQIKIKDCDVECLGDHEWVRIEKFYKGNLLENIHSSTICQGDIGDCYFISGLIYLAKFPDQVKNLFHPSSSLKYGCALVYFNFMGEKLPVIVDTQIPFRDNKPLFSRPLNANDSPWFCLVEKAFAKACGGYKMIETGQPHYAVHILLDWFSIAFSNFKDIKGDIFEKLVKLKAKGAMLGSSVSSTTFPGFTDEEIIKKTGLVINHAYQILDIKRSKDNKYIKLKNPWGDFECKNENYTKHDEKFSDTARNGIFWMPFNEFVNYFSSLSISYPPKHKWNKKSVYGIIKGYLDGRKPCCNAKNTGCIPQWSLKFHQKTVVRLSYEISGPPSYHGLYIAYGSHSKISVLNSDDKMGSITTNSSVNGFQYKIDMFDEPYTIFFVRTDKNKIPCLFRIIIESPDDFTIHKINDDFSDGYSHSISGVFEPGEDDGWDPYDNPPLTTCRQYYFHFKQPTEFRIKLFKNKTKGPLFLFIANTDSKIGYTLEGLKCFNYRIEGSTTYEEYSIYIDNVEKPWIVCVYRTKQIDTSKFQLTCLCKDKFIYGIMPEIDREKDCGYAISGVFKHGDDDGLSPYGGGCVKELKQWNIFFYSSPTNLILNFKVENGTSDHNVYLEQKQKSGDKITSFYKGSFHYDFDIYANAERDQNYWCIEDISKPYSLCVTRNKSNDDSKWLLEIFSKENFKIVEIDGSDIPQIKKEKNKTNYSISFPEIKPVIQPIDFSLKPKKSKLKNANELTFVDIDERGNSQDDENKSVCCLVL